MDWRVRPIDQWPGERTRNPGRAPFFAPWGKTLRLLERELGKLRAKNILLLMNVREDSDEEEEEESEPRRRIRAAIDREREKRRATAPPESQVICLGCGCTDEEACVGPDGVACQWVLEGICSSCWEDPPRQLRELMDEAYRAAP